MSFLDLLQDVKPAKVNHAMAMSSTVEPQSPLDPISPWPPIPPVQSTISVEREESLSPKEIYGLIAVLGTYLAFGIYLIWALCPPSWLDAVGWTWYPSRFVISYVGTSEGS
jgi:hypothetical protein